MNTRNIIGLLLCLPLFLSSSLALAQQDLSQDQEVSQQDVVLLPDNTPDQNQPVFSEPELDQLLAPIALYPDSLLSQILMASTYPLEVVAAARWSKAHPELKGEEAVQAVAQYPWDASVRSLVAFPQILATMDEKLDWMERLGDAFLSQQQEVMDRVQHLRQQASAAGNLSSNEQIQVDQQGQSIVIEPANPQVVYVPYYDPNIVYGSWWWPAYRPVYWAPWPGYFYGPRYGLALSWGFGVPIGPRWWFGAFNWPQRYVTFSPGLVWAHSPIHRHAVPYRTIALQHRFGSVSMSRSIPPQFRGSARIPFNGQGHIGHFSGPRGGFGNRPEVRSHVPGRSTAPSRSNPSWGNHSQFQHRAPAMGSMRPSMPQRQFSQSGRSSFQGSVPRFQGGGGIRGGGHGRGHGGVGGGHGGGRGGGGSRGGGHHR